jgi:FKBP-type peptidyl-prolyl cis-trans isomerase 2
MKDLQNQLENAIESLQKGRRPDFQLTDEMAFGVE